jgi:hypothetical protein
MKTMGANLIEQLRQIKDFHFLDGQRQTRSQFALNILRRNGYSSITEAQRFTSNDVDKLLSFVE